MDGMGLAGGFAAAAGGVQSGFQYARQQQALEQQRKQQELESAEARADAKMKRELLMKEIAAKEKAREIYAMDPKKDFGIDPKDFPNREMYEASLSRHYAAEFRKAGIGEEAVKHESAGGQFFETGTKKVAKSAFAKALSGRTKEAQSDLAKIGFNVGEIKPVKAKDGSMAFQIIDNVNGTPTVLSTLSAAELAGVMGDEDTMMSYLIQKDQQISKTHAELEATVEKERRLKKEGLGQYAATGQTADPTAKGRVEAAHPFVTYSGVTIEGKDHEITMALLRGGHSLESVNKMREGAGLSPILITGTLKKEVREAYGTDVKGLSDEAFDSDENQIRIGINAYNVAKPEIEGRELNANKGGMGSKPKTPTPDSRVNPDIQTSGGGMNESSGSENKTPTETKTEKRIYDDKGFTEEERKEFDDLYNKTIGPKSVGAFTGPNAYEQSQAARKRYKELLSIGNERVVTAQRGMRQNNLSSTIGR